MANTARAQDLFDREYWVAAIDEAAVAANAGESRPAMLFLIGRALEKLNQHPPAMRYLDLVLAAEPEHARARAHRGAVWDRMLQKDRARADLDAALAADPEYGYAWEHLFYVAFDTNDDATCDRAIAQLERLGAMKGYLYRLRGHRRLDRGDRAGAEEDLRKACLHEQSDPFAGELLHGAGIAFQTGDEHCMLGVRTEEQDPEEAVRQYEQALAKGLATPKREGRVVDRMAKQLRQLGRAADGIAAAKALTERHADRADAWLVRASHDGDVASFRRAHELSPKDATAPYVQHLLGAGNADGALAVCTARLADDPDDATVHRLAGEALLALGRKDDAKAAWLRAEALGDQAARGLRVNEHGPERGLDHFDAALGLLDQRLRDDAAAEFETAVDLLREERRAPGDAAHRYLAKALYNSAFLRELKVADEIIEPNLREAIELDPAYPDALSALGNLCIRTERVDEGLEWLARSGTADPAAGQPWYYRARHFANHGAHEQAVADATKAFEAYKGRGQTQFAADAVMMRGQSNEALERLQDALRDYDLAYDFGHPTGYAMGEQIREKIAMADGDSEQAEELLMKVIERIEDGECPWGQIDFLESRSSGDEKAAALVAKLKADTELDDEEREWLVEFLQGS